MGCLFAKLYQEQKSINNKRDDESGMEWNKSFLYLFVSVGILGSDAFNRLVRSFRSSRSYTLVSVACGLGIACVRVSFFVVIPTFAYGLGAGYGMGIFFGGIVFALGSVVRGMGYGRSVIMVLGTWYGMDGIRDG